MFEKTTVGEWVVIGLSVLFALISGTNFGVVLVLSLIILYIIYWVITRVHPKSENWGVILWVIVIGGIPIIVLIGAGIGAGFISGLANPSNQWETYSNFGISFDHPVDIPLNSSYYGFSNATYYKGTLSFDNPNHGIEIAWFRRDDALSPDLIQQTMTRLTDMEVKHGDINFTVSPLQKTSHLGDDIYYITGDGIDTTKNGAKVHDIFAMWECQKSGRAFIMGIFSYESQEDVHALFNGVLKSLVDH